MRIALFAGYSYHDKHVLLMVDKDPLITQPLLQVMTPRYTHVEALHPSTVDAVVKESMNISRGQIARYSEKNSLIK